MRILMLGGTEFVGRTVVETATADGHDVTIFSRGKTGTDLFPEVPRLIGDREAGDYAALASGRWGAVVDVSGYVPRHVGQAMDALGDRVGRYLFMSSHAAYIRAGLPDGILDESTPRRPANRTGTEALTEETYGPLKVACEEDIVARFGDRATIVYPCKVAGPHDNQNGLTYWVRRASRGGRIALPGDPAQPVLLVDARDLARLVVRLLTDERPGAFDASGPVPPITLGELIHLCAAAAGTSVEIVPVEDVNGFFPLVRQKEVWPTLRRSGALARAAGMPATPLAQTIADVRAWDIARGEPPLEGGFTPEEETAALA